MFSVAQSVHTALVLYHGHHGGGRASRSAAVQWSPLVEVVRLLHPLHMHALLEGQHRWTKLNDCSSICAYRCSASGALTVFLTAGEPTAGSDCNG